MLCNDFAKRPVGTAAAGVPRLEKPATHDLKRKNAATTYLSQVPIE
jgi:hypothetical protein